MSFSTKSPSSGKEYQQHLRNMTCEILNKLPLKSEPQYPENSFRYMAEFSLRSPFSNPQNSCACFCVPSFTAFRRPGMGRMPFHVVSGKERGLSTHYEEATNHPIFLFCKILPFFTVGEGDKNSGKAMAGNAYIVEKQS